MFEFFEKSNLKLNETQMEAVSLLLAEKRDIALSILRGVKPKSGSAGKSASKSRPAPKAASAKSKPSGK
jgi:dsDNA-binding SOS-regulon protein